MQVLRELYDLSNYGDNITKENLVRDLFIAGVASTEARCLLYQQDSDTLTIDHCLLLVSSLESVQMQSINMEGMLYIMQHTTDIIIQ